MIRLSCWRRLPRFAAAPAAAQPRRRRARLCQAGELAVPAGPGRHLLEAAADDRAQSQRLWLERPQPGRQEPADRLLLRLSDGVARPRHEQRPHADDAEESALPKSSSPASPAVCRPFAPDVPPDDRRRRSRLSAPARTSAPPARLAYRDVAGAWRNYLATCNQGRPFVLIGHSQGSLMLHPADRQRDRGQAGSRRADEAGDPARLQRAGAAGQTGRRRPSRRRRCAAAPGQTGCVIAWTSFRENNVPPAGAIFGYRRQARHDRRLRQSGAAGIDAAGRSSTAIGTRARRYPVPGGPIAWSSEGPPPTPCLRTEGLVSARCVNDGPRGYLSVRTNADPKDKRTDRIGGEVGLLGMFLPGWGMHLADIAAGAGRPHPDRRRDQSEAIENSSSTGSSSARPASARAASTE